MATVNVTKGRMYLPSDDANNPTNRNVFHPETDINQVIDDKGNPLSALLGSGVKYTASSADTDALAVDKKETLVFEIIAEE